MQTSWRSDVLDAGLDVDYSGLSKPMVPHSLLRARPLFVRKYVGNNDDELETVGVVYSHLYYWLGFGGFFILVPGLDTVRTLPVAHTAHSAVLFLTRGSAGP